ncbi:lipoyl(octanoyl) transferase LipB [Corynebacterium kroppenstedtii]|uniref:lipoyl(octanoyl) transferase LipB n=1 Tax=Corynebacterium sp. PCR 32 TaxID=3351342 RepID=UPI00309F8E29
MGYQHGSIRAVDTDYDIQWLGHVDYMEMWHRQADYAEQRARAAATAEGEPDQGIDRLLFLEHPATYTAGKRTQPEDLPDDDETPLVRIDRGGRITWHGPGQLVGYPIIRLAQPLDVVDYVRRLEEALIRVCHMLGVTSAGRVEGRSGVWLPTEVVGGELRPERKIAAIGLRITRGVTMHGFALNCDNSLEPYRHMIPCGISDAGVTTLTEELGRDVSPRDVLDLVRDSLIAALDGTQPLTDSTIPGDGHKRIKVQ